MTAQVIDVDATGAAGEKARRSRPCPDLRLSVATVYSGHRMVELIDINAASSVVQRCTPTV
jgi:hypothetical protein